MFNINYKIIVSDSDDLIGENGFLQFDCNGFLYGEMYTGELENIMSTISLYNWFERLLEVAIRLKNEKCIYLSDVDSYNTWLEFKLDGKNVVISVVVGESPDGSQAVENFFADFEYDVWYDQKVSYKNFIDEIINKATSYIESVKKLNEDYAKSIFDFESLINRLRQQQTDDYPNLE